jgi:hypothetical protein
MAKRVVRALGLIFGCVFTASLIRGFVFDATVLKFFSVYVLQFYVSVCDMFDCFLV